MNYKLKSRMTAPEAPSIVIFNSDFELYFSGRYCGRGGAPGPIGSGTLGSQDRISTRCAPTGTPTHISACVVALLDFFDGDRSYRLGRRNEADLSVFHGFALIRDLATNLDAIWSIVALQPAKPTMSHVINAALRMPRNIETTPHEKLNMRIHRLHLDHYESLMPPASKG